MFLRKNARFSPDEPAAERGKRVITVDGDALGTVSDVSGSYLKVDAPHRHEYWLSADYISSIDDGIRMRFSKRDLDEYKLPEPGLEPEDDPLRGIARSAVILSEQEQLEQRARMERELAEQRERLPELAGGTVGEPVEDELPRLESVLGVAPEPEPAAVLSPTGAIVSREETPRSGVPASTNGVTTAEVAASASREEVDLMRHWSAISDDETERRRGSFAFAIAAVLIVIALAWLVLRRRGRARSF